MRATHPPPKPSLTAKVRVTGSALAATSRTTPCQVVLAAHTRTATELPALMAATLSSGTENTTSRGPSWAMRTTKWPCRQHLALFGLYGSDHA